MPFPCDGHGDGSAGPVRGLALALVSDGFRFTAYKRYCNNCMMVLFKDHHADWLPGTLYASRAEITACTCCGEQVPLEAKLRPFYVTTWTRGGDRLSYYGMYCDNCATMARDTFDLKEAANGHR